MIISAKSKLKTMTAITAAVTAFLLTLSANVSAQTAGDPAVMITSPSEWTTLRSDSVSVSVQVDTARLPGGTINFKVVRRSGSRSSVLFSKSVKADASSIDVFLGRVKGAPVGGTDYLSIEWSVSDASGLKGVVEPIGIAALSGSLSPENKWVPANPYLSAVRLKDGLSGENAAEALAALRGSSVGGADFSAGWNASGLFLYFKPTSSVPAAEFAFDLKFGANAFTAWADRFLTVGADSAYGVRASKRSVDKDGMKTEESSWGDAKSVVFTESGAGRLVMLEWSELGVLPFDGRNIGFAVFAKGKNAAYPAGAARSIPGTWGGISLAK